MELVLQMIADCLKTDAEDIALALTTRTTLTKGEHFVTPLTLQKVLHSFLKNFILSLIFFFQKTNKKRLLNLETLLPNLYMMVYLNGL